ncbi:MAG: hypothetical protein OXG99_01690, partial [Alphaproteobacteria bacterium]|nr:hypothetical protein [Alphaproteobacteria bacterium]
ASNSLGAPFGFAVVFDAVYGRLFFYSVFGAIQCTHNGVSFVFCCILLYRLVDGTNISKDLIRELERAAGGSRSPG